MKIGLGDVMKAVNAAGAVNPEAKKISKGYSFVRHILISAVMFLLGLLFFFVVWYIGLVLILLSVLVFFATKKNKQRFDYLGNMRMDLKNSPSLDEGVSRVFTDIENDQGRDDYGVREELENVMLLTERRIIFMYVPRVGIEDLTQGNIVGAIGNAVDYNGLRKKVENEIQSKGVRKMIKNYRGYSMNYDEIEEIKVNSSFGSVTFFYRGHSFRYSIRRDDFEEFRQIFANYIKV